MSEVISAEKHENLNAEDAQHLSNSEVQKLSGPGIPSKGGKHGRKGIEAEAGE